MQQSFVTWWMHEKTGLCKLHYKGIIYILTHCVRWWFLCVQGDQVQVGDTGGVWWWKSGLTGLTSIWLSVFCLLFLCLFFFNLSGHLQFGSTHTLSWNLNFQNVCWQDRADRNTGGIFICSMDARLVCLKVNLGHVWPSLHETTFENMFFSSLLFPLTLATFARLYLRAYYYWEPGILQTIRH